MLFSAKLQEAIKVTNKLGLQSHTRVRLWVGIALGLGLVKFGLGWSVVGLSWGWVKNLGPDKNLK